uniref:Uncharacterized protein n=1 Tax=Knipowitschia caucasica TaxID=637954 RepID=A0AAV2M870_KNICA
MTWVGARHRCQPPCGTARTTQSYHRSVTRGPSWHRTCNRHHGDSQKALTPTLHCPVPPLTGQQQHEQRTAAGYMLRSFIAAPLMRVFREPQSAAGVEQWEAQLPWDSRAMYTDTNDRRPTNKYHCGGRRVKMFRFKCFD